MHSDDDFILEDSRTSSKMLKFNSASTSKVADSSIGPVVKSTKDSRNLTENSSKFKDFTKDFTKDSSKTEGCTEDSSTQESHWQGFWIFLHAQVSGY